jgi:ABC-type Fe3+ transport system substrate-binding protein
MRIMSGVADAGVTWVPEVRFQESIGNPIEGVVIPAEQNTTTVFAGRIVKGAPHSTGAARRLTFLQSEEAQAIYRQFGFGYMATDFK